MLQEKICLITIFNMGLNVTFDSSELSTAIMLRLIRVENRSKVWHKLKSKFIVNFRTSICNKLFFCHVGNAAFNSNYYFSNFRTNSICN